jgi:hypothetical protein
MTVIAGAMLPMKILQIGSEFGTVLELVSRNSVLIFSRLPLELQVITVFDTHLSHPSMSVH